MPVAACLYVNVGVVCFSVFSSRVCCVRVSVCFACSHSVCVWLPVFLSIVLRAAYADNGILSHKLTHTHMSEMPSGGYLCFPDTLHQTISSTVYTAGLRVANKSQRSQDMCAVRSDLRQLQLLFLFIKACHNSISTSSNDFLSSDVCFYRMRRSLSRR